MCICIICIKANISLWPFCERDILKLCDCVCLWHRETDGGMLLCFISLAFHLKYLLSSLALIQIVIIVCLYTLDWFWCVYRFSESSSVLQKTLKYVLCSTVIYSVIVLTQNNFQCVFQGDLCSTLAELFYSETHIQQQYSTGYIRTWEIEKR